MLQARDMMTEEVIYVHKAYSGNVCASWLEPRVIFTEGRIKMRHLLLMLVLLISGCVSTEVVQREIEQCPQYFQDNVGEAKILPIWSAVIPLFGGPIGWLNEDGSYTLTSLADRDVLLHEAFHSFHFRTYQQRRDEHKRFVAAWGGVPEPQLALYLICAAVPIVGKVPVPGHVNLYGCSNVVEDAAETFVFSMRGQKRNDNKLMNKCAVIESFVNGAYSHGTQAVLGHIYDPKLLIATASDE